MSRSESADRIRAKIQADDVVRVAIMLFGQPGCDNSSLINRLIDSVVHAKEFTVPVLCRCSTTWSSTPTPSESSS